MRIFYVFLVCLFTVSTSHAVTLNATKINSAGVWAAGSAVPTWLQMANTAGAFAARVNPYVAIGSAIAQWALSDQDGAVARITPNSTSGIAPDGWAGPDSPPSTGSGVYNVPSSYGTFPISSISDAGAVAALCDGGSICHWTEFNQKSPSTTCSYTGNGTFSCTSSYLQCGAGMANPCTPQTFNWTKVINVGCASGYTLTNGVCTLSNPSAAKWPSDGEPTVYPNGSGFSPHPRDPDVGNNPFSVNTPYTRQGYDSQGNPISETVTPNASGGFTWERTQQGVGADGNTAVQKDGVSVNSSGSVTNVYSNTYNNSTLTNINTNSSTPVDVSSLAKEGTLQQTNTKLGEIKDLLNPSPLPFPSMSPLAQPYTDIKNSIDGIQGDYPNNPAPDLNMPVWWTYASGTCFPAEFDMGRFGVLSFEKFCFIYDTYIRAVIVWLLGVWTTISLFSFWYSTVREI